MSANSYEYTTLSNIEECCTTGKSSCRAVYDHVRTNVLPHSRSHL